MRSVIAGILALAALVFLILEAARLVDVDFLVYLGAADALMSGQDLYNNFNVGGLPFTYPPFAGAVFIPFDLFPPTAAFAIWTAGSAAASWRSPSAAPLKRSIVPNAQRRPVPPPS